MIAMRTHHGSEISNWRAYFAGAWRMSRRIDDRRGARAGTAWGEAIFAAMEGGESAILSCNEALIIDYGGSRIAGEQKTVWRFGDARGPDLHFRDGRFFCAMLFREERGVWRAEFSHDCGEDRYEGAALVTDESNWRLVWNVIGPRKDYSLDTAYSRIVDAHVNAPACKQSGRKAGCAEILGTGLH
ncbi:MAG: DUF6314 family protein [Pseudomonadota bacterium]